MSAAGVKALVAVIEWLHEVFGPIELQIGGWYCDRCRDIHPDGMRCCDLCDELHSGVTRCPRQLYDDCVDCGRVVEVDRFGCCRVGGATHVVANRIRSTRRRSGR